MFYNIITSVFKNKNKAIGNRNETSIKTPTSFSSSNNYTIEYKVIIDTTSVKGFTIYKTCKI